MTYAPGFRMNGFSRVESHGAVPLFGIFGAICSFTNRSAACASSSNSTACKSNSARSSRCTEIAFTPRLLPLTYSYTASPAPRLPSQQIVAYPCRRWARVGPFSSDSAIVESRHSSASEERTCSSSLRPSASKCSWCRTSPSASQYLIGLDPSAAREASSSRPFASSFS